MYIGQKLIVISEVEINMNIVLTEPFTDEAPTALFKDPIRTAL
jgi:hypothetical protein